MPMSERMKTIDKEYNRNLATSHASFREVQKAILKQMGLSAEPTHETHDTEVVLAYHEALLPHKRAFVAEQSAHQVSRANGASRLPRKAKRLN